MIKLTSISKEVWPKKKGKCKYHKDTPIKFSDCGECYHNELYDNCLSSIEQLGVESDAMNIAALIYDEFGGSIELSEKIGRHIQANLGRILKITKE